MMLFTGKDMWLLLFQRKNLFTPMVQEKKTVVMGIEKTIKLIKKTANLDVISIKRIT